ncbi:MAG: hypothetical protein RIQ52_1783 [Pseudomonadota bacterium]|jgi:hypothetical protein
MLNYFLLTLTAFVGIVFLDDDMSSVSGEEWILYGILLYAAWSFLQQYRETIRQYRRPE